jgi:hypothetical protein
MKTRQKRGEIILANTVWLLYSSVELEGTYYPLTGPTTTLNEAQIKFMSFWKTACRTKHHKLNTYISSGSANLSENFLCVHI